uniref:Uncharacterized protein n=1 Tax=Anopheles minimus TaxID=112268 RepID=A0A182WN49_9DIPT
MSVQSCHLSCRRTVKCARRTASDEKVKYRCQG